MIIVLQSCEKKVKEFPRFDGLYISEKFDVGGNELYSYMRFFEDGMVRETYVKPDQDIELVMEALDKDNSLDLPLVEFKKNGSRVEFEVELREGLVGYSCKPESADKISVRIVSGINQNTFTRTYTFSEVD